MCNEEYIRCADGSSLILVGPRSLFAGVFTLPRRRRRRYKNIRKASLCCVRRRRRWRDCIYYALRTWLLNAPPTINFQPDDALYLLMQLISRSVISSIWTTLTTRVRFNSARWAVKFPLNGQQLIWLSELGKQSTHVRSCWNEVLDSAVYILQMDSEDADKTMISQHSFLSTATCALYPILFSPDVFSSFIFVFIFGFTLNAGVAFIRVTPRRVDRRIA